MVDIGPDAGVVLDNIIVGGRSRSLRRLLRYEEEVVSLIQRHFIVDHGAAVNVSGGSSVLLLEKPRVNTLTHDDESDSWHFPLLYGMVSSSTSILNEKINEDQFKN